MAPPPRSSTSRCCWAISTARDLQNRALDAIGAATNEASLSDSMLQTYALKYQPTVKKVQVSNAEKLCLSAGDLSRGARRERQGPVGRRQRHHQPRQCRTASRQRCAASSTRTPTRAICAASSPSPATAGRKQRRKPMPGTSAQQMAATAWKEYKSGETPGVLPEHGALLPHDRRRSVLVGQIHPRRRDRRARVLLRQLRPPADRAAHPARAGFFICASGRSFRGQRRRGELQRRFREQALEASRSGDRRRRASGQFWPRIEQRLRRGHRRRAGTAKPKVGSVRKSTARELTGERGGNEAACRGDVDAPADAIAAADPAGVDQPDRSAAVAQPRREQVAIDRAGGAT